VLGVAFACNCTPPVVPLGEALFVVDTDMPIPRLVGRLRIDFYSASGAWFGSRDVLALKESDWPITFSAYLRETDAPKTAFVRLRAYPDLGTRAYEGERFVPRAPDGDPFALPEPPATNEPRLLDASGSDITPPLEPAPLLAIDRLVAIHLQLGTRGAVRIMLKGDCVGTMSDVANAMTCVDAEAPFQAVAPSALDPDMKVPSHTSERAFGTWDGQSCDVPPRPDTQLYDEDVCVPGGAFVFGSADSFVGGVRDDLPKRVAVVPPFLIDKYEVTVGRFRKAIADGFDGGAPHANNGPLGNPASDPNGSVMCTWSIAPLNREAYPVNCIDPGIASAFCKWAGGDLPREVQWEYAAALSGRSDRTRYPWGDDDPACNEVLFGRTNMIGPGTCAKSGFGPGPIAMSSGDVTPNLEIVGLGGSFTEFMADTFASMRSTCWMGAPLVSPGCDATGDIVLRGGSWATPTPGLIIALRSTFPHAESTSVGFRCVRPGVAQ
jgi:formylglycine-generating enzyme required for sulfatase activity